MKGTDLTQKQLDAAEDFVLLCRSSEIDALTALGLKETPNRMVTMTWSSLVRIVAFYGSIRAKSVLDGGSVEEPGETYKTGKK